MSDYNIPLFNLNYGEEEIEAVTDVIRSKWISMGPKCQELEEMMCSMLDVKYACAVTNCTASLHLATYALGLGEGDEVICPSLSFAATANCIKYVNATPVFCDITSYEDFCINPAKIRELITPKTKAIVVMHYAGFPCNMDEVLAITKEYDLKVIEDACHGPLSEYAGRKLGTIGDVGCFSFFSNKNISTGEGGVIVTNDKDIYDRIKLARSHGMTTMSYQRAKGHATSYDIELLGFNYRMDDIRASLACVQLGKLQKDLEQRIQVRDRYIKKLEGARDLVIPYKDNTNFVSNYIFPTLVMNSDSTRRDKIRSFLQDRGIQTSVHYPAIHRFSIYHDDKDVLPYTDYVTDNEITLPMYAALSDTEIDYVCDTYKEALETL